MFAVITGDFIESKKKGSVFSEDVDIKLSLLNDNELNSKIKNKHLKINKAILDHELKILNSDFKTEINVLKGDEVQFILKLNENFFDNLIKVRAIFYPYKLRIGIGLFENYSEIFNGKSKNSWIMNGEPFFLARKALDEIEDIRETVTKIKGINEEFSFALNITFKYIDDILDRWGEDFYLFYILSKKYGTQKEVATQLNLDPKNLSKRLKTAKKHKIDEITKEVISYYKSYFEGDC